MFGSCSHISDTQGVRLVWSKFFLERKPSVLGNGINFVRLIQDNVSAGQYSVMQKAQDYLIFLKVLGISLACNKFDSYVDPLTSCYSLFSSGSNPDQIASTCQLLSSQRMGEIGLIAYANVSPLPKKETPSHTYRVHW